MKIGSVLLAYHSNLLRGALARLLRDADVGIVYESGDLNGALTFLRSTTRDQIDLVILDAALCKNRTNVLGVLQRAGSSARVVILTHDINAIDDPLLAADGVLTFDITAETMVRSLSLVHGGERVMPRELMQSIAARSQDGRERHTRSTVSRPGSSQAPSPREAEILQRLLQGHPNKTIALQLGITETTVKVHLKSLLRKVNASNRTQAAVWALNNGYTAHGSAFGGTGPEGGMKPNEINDYGQHNGSLMGSRRGKPH